MRLRKARETTGHVWRGSDACQRETPPTRLNPPRPAQRVDKTALATMNEGPFAPDSLQPGQLALSRRERLLKPLLRPGALRSAIMA